MSNTTVVWNSYPKGGLPEENVSFKIEQRETPTLSADGEILVKLHYLSVDPYMRGRMRDNLAGYFIGCFQIGEPLSGGCVAEVTESRNPDYQVGDIVQGFLNWQLVQVVKPDPSTGKLAVEKVPRFEGISISTAVGVLGLTGLTAYFGLLDITHPKAGETVVVSGAAGAVGQIVGQIAKIKGCHVVGIAGGEEKVKLLKERYGFDEAINYKVEDTFEKMNKAIQKACPKGVDVYFDNTGGYISDAVTLQINSFARISLCGAISTYNAEELMLVQGPRTDFLLVTKQAKKEGFLVFRWADRYPEAIKELVQWIREGKIVHDETVVEGIENAPRAFIDLMNGKNIGKMIVKI